MTAILIIAVLLLLALTHFIAWRHGYHNGYHKGYYDQLNEPHPPWLAEAIERVREEDAEKEMFVRPAVDSDREH